EQLRVSGGDAVPAQGVEVGGELARLIEAPLGHHLPTALAQHLKVDLTLQEHREALADRLVFHAGHRHHGVATGLAVFLLLRLDALHQVAAGAAAHHCTGFEPGEGLSPRHSHGLSLAPSR
ncbi:MAG: hypothetical protein ACK55I_21465, partial [bacterium]